MNCNHEWVTVFKDYSGNGGMDDFYETIRGYYDASMYHQCKLCKLIENDESLKAYPRNVGYGDYETPGRLSRDELEKVLVARK